MSEDNPDTIKITIKCHRSDTELLKKEIYEYLMSHRIGIDDVKFRKTCLECGNDTWHIEVRKGRILFECAKCNYRMSAKYTGSDPENPLWLAKLEDFT